MGPGEKSWHVSFANGVSKNPQEIMVGKSIGDRRDRKIRRVTRREPVLEKFTRPIDRSIAGRGKSAAGIKYACAACLCTSIGSHGTSARCSDGCETVSTLLRRQRLPKRSIPYPISRATPARGVSCLPSIILTLRSREVTLSHYLIS